MRNHFLARRLLCCLLQPARLETDDSGFDTDAIAIGLLLANLFHKCRSRAGLWRCQKGLGKQE